MENGMKRKIYIFFVLYIYIYIYIFFVQITLFRTDEVVALYIHHKVISFSRGKKIRVCV